MRQSIGVLVFSLLIWAGTAFGSTGSVSTTVQYPPPDIQAIGDYSRVTIPGAHNFNQPGTPNLPSAGVWLLLPPGEEAVGVTVSEEKWERLSGKYSVEPTNPPHILSDPSPLVQSAPDPAIYGSDVPYPALPVADLSTHFKRGWALATCLVYPVRWNPSTGIIEYLASARITLTTEPSPRAVTAFNDLYRGTKEMRTEMNHRVANGDMIGRYPARDADIPPAMLVVTVEPFLSQAELYADWRAMRGMPTYIKTVNEIVDAYPGRDTQEKIRNAVADAYRNDNVAHLIIMGDADLVPHRGFCANVNNEDEKDIPADWYYSAFDGTWNTDNDAYWGESNESDLLAEVTVGRIPASDSLDLANGLLKTYKYADTPVVEDVPAVLMVGEELGWAKMGSDYMEELYAGSNLYGYTTKGFPRDWKKGTLYDTKDFEWTAHGHLAPLINEGYNFINHLGHANTWTVMKFNRDNLDANVLINGGGFNGHNVLYTQGCYCGSFDNRTTTVGTYEEKDCISEYFIGRLWTGFVAMIANSRYGWGSGNDTNGPSQMFHRQYADAIFSENYTLIGRANQDSKEDGTPWMNNQVIRWCFWEANLFGDPALDLWVNSPDTMIVDCPPVIIIGQPDFTVNFPGVTEGYATLSRNNKVLAQAEIGADGKTVFDLPEPIQPPGEVILKAVARNYIPRVHNLVSIPAENGYPWVVEFDISDFDGVPDGVINPGERIELTPKVHNMGQGILDGLEILAECADARITLAEKTVEFQPIGSDSISSAQSPITFTVDKRCKDNSTFNLNLTMTDGDGNSWDQKLSLTIHGSVLKQKWFTVYDTAGNNNGRLDPGETAEILLTMKNQGSGRAGDMVAVLASSTPLAEVTAAQSACELMEPGETADFEQRFKVQMSPDLPNPYRVVFTLKIASPVSAPLSYIVPLEVGGLSYNFDTAQPDLITEAVQAGGNEWHVSVQDNQSFKGTKSLKVGKNFEGGKYAKDLNCVAYLPKVEVTTPLHLTFRHRYFTEYCKTKPEPPTGYDGAFLEVSVDDSAWQILYPTTPAGKVYPRTVIHGGTPSPFPEGHPIYSDITDWETALFDLSEFQGHSVQVRFHFFSDGAVGKEGWYIDDISYAMPMLLDIPLDLKAELVDDGVSLTWNPPVPSRDDYIPNELYGYRVYLGIDDLNNLDTLITDHKFYLDMMRHREGDYMFVVSAMYKDGESMPSNLAELKWIKPEVGVEPEVAGTPLKFDITAVYPNPFNGLSRISYSVLNDTPVELAVYDRTGRLVSSLVKAGHRAGNYTATFDGSRLASGIYFVRLSTPDAVRSTKLVLIK